MRIDRRRFLQQGLAVGTALALPDLNALFGAENQPATSAAPSGGTPQLVAVRNGARARMVDAALKALGGMSAFVKPGQSVVIKPNIGWDVVPELGANTHPEVVRRLVELCEEAGAKTISVFDNTCDPWQRAYANSGIEAALKSTSARLVNGKDETQYRPVSIPGAKRLKEANVHALILDSDVYINAPVLKSHSGATMTACVKNAMGVVWDRRYWHKNDLHQCIAEFHLLRKPNLNVLDAYHPMVKNGPRGSGPGDLVEMQCLLASPDLLAADAAAAKLLGHQPADIRYLPIAAELGLGSIDLDKLRIERIQLS